MQKDIELKGLTLRPHHFVLVANGEHIELNVSETRIMEMLMSDGGGAVETKTFLGETSITLGSLRASLHHLRHKLRGLATIRNVSGYGYMLKVAEQEVAETA